MSASRRENNDLYRHASGILPDAEDQKQMKKAVSFCFATKRNKKQPGMSCAVGGMV